MIDRIASKSSVAVQELLSKLDIDATGVVPVKEVKGSRLEETARRLLPEVRSVVMLARGVYPEVLRLANLGKEAGKPHLYELMDRHLEYLAGRLTKAAYDLAEVSHKHGLKALPLPSAGCPSDARFLEAVFSFKHAAQAAGMGTFGRSSLILTPRFGPRVRLVCCLTEAELEPTGTAQSGASCEGCDVCIENCPAGALIKAPDGQPYSINKFACSAFRTASGGCCECVRLCPAGKPN